GISTPRAGSRLLRPELARHGFHPILSATATWAHVCISRIALALECILAHATRCAARHSLLQCQPQKAQSGRQQLVAGLEPPFLEPCVVSNSRSNCPAFFAPARSTLIIW